MTRITCLCVGLGLALFSPEPVLVLAAVADEGIELPAMDQGKTDSTARSVVKIYSTARLPSVYKPWTKEPPTEVSASGVVIDGHRILTCAHAVLYSSRVQVLDMDSGGRINARVDAVAPDMDLAVLKLEDEGFFGGHPPLPISKELPDIRDSVLAYGYPVGGDNLSITKGIVSRIEFTSYGYPATGLRIQIDAAVNPGNSGGPALVDGNVIGLAFSYLNGTQNIGYIIPSEEIELFLGSVVKGKYRGKPSLFGECQMLGNPVLSSYLKLNRSVQGIIMHKPDSDDPDYPLKRWDVITHIGNVPIDDAGTVRLNDDVRVFFKYMIQKVAKDGQVSLTVIRDGKETKLNVPVPADRPLAIPSLGGSYPSYFVYGPLVFTPATIEFVSHLMESQRGGTVMGVLSASGSSLVKRMGDRTQFEGEQLVVVPCPLFPHRLSAGYSDPAFQVLKLVNGVPIRNLAHLVRTLRDCKEDYVTFDFDVRNGQTIVFRRSDVDTATEEVLTDNDIRSQASPDMLAIWNEKQAAATR